MVAAAAAVVAAAPTHLMSFDGVPVVGAVSVCVDRRRDACQCTWNGACGGDGSIPWGAPFVFSGAVLFMVLPAMR